MTRYDKSKTLLERALACTPLGAQTFSKSPTQFPIGSSPHFLARGKGAHVWDVDGNEYVDLICGLASVTLGYRDPDVDAAVLAQLENGVTFSLSHPLEIEVAERLIAAVPCAERVRFLKNGSDATGAAVRVARAQTGRDHVVTCGYHGWQDWTIGTTTRDLGVPDATRALSHTFAYNDPDSLAAVLREHQVACVILEPQNVTTPEDGFLEAIARMTRAHGALLVFDETVTGFRYARGGAQELYGVTPDLATFGKGLANGFPLSALVGRAGPMKLLEEVFVSTTFGGETLSLAAAGAVLDKLEREPVLETIAARGTALMEGARAAITTSGLEESINVKGHPSWSFLLIGDAAPYTSWELKTLFLQESLERGLLTLGTQNVCYALTEADVEQVLNIYGEVFAELRAAIDAQDLPKRLRCEPLKPLFKVR